MKIKFVSIILVLSLFNEYNLNAQQSVFDFSGIEHFWPIYEKLKQNENPTEDEWEPLFITKGFQILLKSEFDKSYFKNYYSLAFMPDKKDDLNKELLKTHWKIQYLKHLNKINSEKTRITEKMNELMGNKEVLTNSLRKTTVFLPENVIPENDLPPVSFVFFGNDARGYSRIIIDLLYYIDNEEAMNYLVAHEAHHYYRNKNLQLTDIFRNESEQQIVWSLNQLQAEGIADQIDKPNTYFNNGVLSESKWAIRFKEYYEESEIIVARLDSILTEIESHPSDIEKLAVQFANAIPMSGHPTGYYMAKAIIKELGKDILVENWTDPFEFILLYQKAAKKSENIYPLFSNQSIRLIKEYEMVYAM